MKSNFGDLSFNWGNSVDNLFKKLGKRAKAWEKDGMKRMNSAVDIVYNTARAKRPMTNLIRFAKGDTAFEDTNYGPGRVPREISKSFRVRKVSNPDAKFGVPVRTGNLQKSIKKSVTLNFHKIIGTVWVDEKQAPYAKYLEYGTSKMPARPFMRPAKDINRKLIKDIIGSDFKE